MYLAFLITEVDSFFYLLFKFFFFNALKLNLMLGFPIFDVYKREREARIQKRRELLVGEFNRKKESKRENRVAYNRVVFLREFSFKMYLFFNN